MNATSTDSGGKLRGVGGREQRVDVSLACLAAGRLDVIEKLLRNVDRDHATILSDRLGEQSSEQAGSGADVGDRLPRLNLACRHDFMATGEQLSALDFEAADEFRSHRDRERNR